MTINRGLFATDSETAAARWVQRKLGDSRHERRVLAIAARLFELTRPLLALARSEYRLLRLGALTHDIGRSVDEKDHPAEGARLIAGTTALDLSPYDRRVLAFLAEHHRGDVPPIHKELHLGQADPRRPLRKVLGLLRVADALDSRQIAAPELVFTLTGRKLRVRCLVEGDLAEAKAVFRRRKKFHLLESFLGTEISVEVERDKVPA
ncbi:MAG TPA: HD domain-containing protein [Tepidisphaeraceae bacterium]|jgi:exopolyphosphatase/guanosine-5'-triphosphate,3'-diphosphate pyrophosphatase